MGLFDVFKKKRQPETIDKTPVKEPYLGDLEKTQLIFELINVPGKNRGRNGKSLFWKILYVPVLDVATHRLLAAPQS